MGQTPPAPAEKTTPLTVSQVADRLNQLNDRFLVGQINLISLEDELKTLRDIIDFDADALKEKIQQLDSIHASPELAQVTQKLNYLYIQTKKIQDTQVSKEFVHQKLLQMYDALEAVVETLDSDQAIQKVAVTLGSQEKIQHISEELLRLKAQITRISSIGGAHAPQETPSPLIETRIAEIERKLAQPPAKVVSTPINQKDIHDKIDDRFSQLVDRNDELEAELKQLSIDLHEEIKEKIEFEAHKLQTARPSTPNLDSFWNDKKNEIQHQIEESFSQLLNKQIEFNQQVMSTVHAAKSGIDQKEWDAWKENQRHHQDAFEHDIIKRWKEATPPASAPAPVTPLKIDAVTLSRISNLETVVRKVKEELTSIRNESPTPPPPPPIQKQPPMKNDEWDRVQGKVDHLLTRVRSLEDGDAENKKKKAETNNPTIIT